MKRFEFTGSGFEYFKIWIVNIMLTIITLGIYYPWAKVRNNRYLYANSLIEDKNFEYHATGKQLLFGYLIAATIFILYNVLEVVLPIASLVLIVLFLFILPWIIWRSMKFNLNVTSFNNVRFKFTGGVKESYIIFLAIPIIFLISLGLIIFVITQFKDTPAILILGIIIVFITNLIATAYFNVLKSRYLIDFANYGDASFETNLSTPEFIKILLKTTLVGILSFIVIGLISAGISYALINIEDAKLLIEMYKTDPENAIPLIFGMFWFIIIFVYISFIAVSIISYAYYITKQRAYIFENTTLDEEVNFSSTMQFLSYAFILVTNFIMILLTFGLAYPWAKVRVAKYTLKNTTMELQNGFDGYFSKKEKESALGEQMSDAFDVDINIPF